MISFLLFASTTAKWQAPSVHGMDFAANLPCSFKVVITRMPYRLPTRLINAWKQRSILSSHLTLRSVLLTHLWSKEPQTDSILDVSVKVPWSSRSGNGTTSLPLTLPTVGLNSPGGGSEEVLEIALRLASTCHITGFRVAGTLALKWMSSGAVDKFHCFPVITVVPGLLCICRAPWTSTHCPEWRRKW